MPNVNMVPLLLSEDNLFLFLYMCSHSCSVLLLYVCVCVCVRAPARCSGNDGTQGHCAQEKCLNSYTGMVCCMSFLKVCFIQENLKMH